MAKVAFISRTEALVTIVSKFLKEAGHDVVLFTEYNKSIAIKEPAGFDVIVIDDQEIRSIGTYSPLSSPKLILLGDLKPSFVNKTIIDGTWDCISKPIEIGKVFLPETIEKFNNRLLGSISAAVEMNQQEYDIAKLDRSGIIGESQSIKSCLATLIPAIESDLSILIMGETGTGKELFAKAVQRNDPKRSKKPFIPMNCSTITESLADGILFGWEKGAHSTADKGRDGLLIEAHEGILFLDEVGDLSLENQTRLLRCIQEKEVTRIGASKPTPADFRVLAATNKKIPELIEVGQFRKDLYYRICDFTIYIPPLRSRREDIKKITEYYIQQICEDHKISPVKTYTDDFLEALQIWDWPGNVRELQAAVRFAIFMAGKTEILNIHHLSTDLRAYWTANSISKDHDFCQATLDELNMGVGDVYHGKPLIDPSCSGSGDVTGVSIDPNQSEPFMQLRLISRGGPTLNDVEKNYLMQLLEKVDKNLITAAQAIEMSGLKKDAYYGRLKKHGLKQNTKT